MVVGGSRRLRGISHHMVMNSEVASAHVCALLVNGV